VSQLLQLFNLLATYGPKIGPIMEEVQRVVDAFAAALESIRLIIGSGVRADGPAVLSADESAAKQKLIDLIVKEQGVKGPWLDRFFALIERYPQLVTLLLSLLS
jgi:hypothetical protein